MFCLQHFSTATGAYEVKMFSSGFSLRADNVPSFDRLFLPIEFWRKLYEKRKTFTILGRLNQNFRFVT